MVPGGKPKREKGGCPWRAPEKTGGLAIAAKKSGDRRRAAKNAAAKSALSEQTPQKL